LNAVSATELFLSMMIGTVGLAVFVYGKRAQRLPHLITPCC